ncbi:UDP-N-acetyl-D-galactosamine dehydrogenase [Luteimonas cucumeris]|uniref:UDP-N-acetyl-D-galactosamine dehydrogenase n=1 Tax=Luteimonas cucumeris TaxID=985012 RepID=A0A562LA95_9GAMM|nr:nucleotide sugar dehydrogenase [Luteimonas cucumeris]TWI04485.1 UDP-N-acetyl-D-galactosamine dehydrogenase [Luteimonas cucumeris]
MRDIAEARIAIIGLGYVGLPLAVEFGRTLDVVGFDIDPQRIAELREGHDRTLETTAEALRTATRITLTQSVEDLGDCNVYIVTVPTPIDAEQRPDLRPLQLASRTLATVLKHGDLVIYESTVYPGTTEEVCVPLLEEGSGLRFNTDFFCGYSPERINPGDHKRPLPSIVKITSGSTPEIAAFVDALYASIITAGTHRAPSIRVAEAAKVIENVQRDVNIALVNELSLIFDRLGIDTLDVLEAAGTKWNFLPFRPGLVGGHCIGVDPYYLMHKSEAAGYHPELIEIARAINNKVGRHVAERVLALMGERDVDPARAKVLVLGLTFKENCPDLRNSRVMNVVDALREAGAAIDVWDPWADPDEAEHELGLRPMAMPASTDYDAVVLAVAHRQFAAMNPVAIRALAKPGAVVYDVKSAWPRDAVDDRL